MSKVVLTDASGKNKSIKVSYRFVPEFIISRINSINLNEKVSVGSRLTTYEDMFNIFKSQPIIGHGASAWAALYPQYQTELYYTEVIHNYLAQLLVEMGILGGIAFALLLFTILYSLYRAYRQNDDSGAVLSLAALLLLGHSIIDFDMAYLSLMMLLWILLASTTHTPNISITRNRVLTNVVFAIIIVIPIVSSISFAIANNEYNTAVDFKTNKDFDSAIIHYQSSIKFNPFASAARYELADMLHAKSSISGDSSYSKEAKTVLEKAYQYEPYNLNVLKFMIDNNIVLGDFDETIKLTDQMIQAAPLREDPYQTQLNACSIMGDYFVNQGNAERASIYYRYPEKGVYVRLAKNKISDNKVLFSREYMNNMQKMQYAYLNINDEDKFLYLSSIKFISLFDFDVDYNDVPDDWKLVSDRLSTDVVLTKGQYFEVHIDTTLGDNVPENLFSIKSVSGTEEEIKIENVLNNDGNLIYVLKTADSYNPSNHQLSIAYDQLDNITSFELYIVQ